MKPGVCRCTLPAIERTAPELSEAVLDLLVREEDRLAKNLLCHEVALDISHV